MEPFFSNKSYPLEVQSLWKHTIRVDNATGVLLNNGLILTNHHVIAPFLKHATKEFADGFIALNYEDELRLDLDVSQPVQYINGSFVYQKLETRLVFCPALNLAVRKQQLKDGLPNYALDFALLRAYSDGSPFQEPGIKLANTFLQEGEIVFAAGHPEITRRRLTTAELQYERDIELPRRLHRAQKHGSPTQIRIARTCIQILDTGGIERHKTREAEFRQQAAQVCPEIDQAFEDIETLCQFKRNTTLPKELETIQTKIMAVQQKIMAVRQTLGDHWKDANSELRLLSGTTQGVNAYPYALAGLTQADTYLLDLDITSGCSGGPVINIRGELVGILYGGNTASLFGIFEKLPNSRALALSLQALQITLSQQGIELTSL